MTNFSKKRTKSVAGVDKSLVMPKLRESVVTVLSKAPNYSHLLENPGTVGNIADAVFSSIYKKNKNMFILRKGETFEDMISNIMFNTKKVCQVEETKKQIIQAAEIIKGDDVGTISFEVLKANVTEKLDKNFSQDLDFFESKFKNEVDSLIYAGSDLSLKELPSRKDLLYLDLILVAEGTNSNKDTIIAQELEEKYLTLIGMPLVEEHEQQAIRGVFFDSKLIRIKAGKEKGSVKIVKTGGKLAVRAKAYVYKNRFPREAYMLKNKQEQGLLRYSVELAFSRAECGVCGESFKPSEVYCEHLMLRNSVKDPTFSRIVRDVYFIGGAYTSNPAEKMAVSLDVFDPSDEKSKESNKTKASCVITIDDTGKVNTEIKDSQKNNEKLNADGDTKSSNPDGGQRMKYEYDSVEELLASPEVNALIEANVSSVLAEEREGFEQSLETLEEQEAGYKTKIEELEATLVTTKEEQDKAKSLLASMEEDKRISDAILDLQNAGYDFDSDEDIKAFSDNIKEMSEEQSVFIIDMMKKNVMAKEETPEAKEKVEAEDKGKEAEAKEEDKEDAVVKASQNADLNASANENQTLLTVRKNWDQQVVDLQNRS